MVHGSRAAWPRGAVLLLSLLTGFGLAPTRAAGDDLAGRLQAHVKHLAGAIGDRNVEEYEHLTKAADYLSQQLAATGHQVHRQTFEAGGKEVCNLVADDPTDDPSHGIVVFGAHYDSHHEPDATNPGADDNASGVAALIELARLLHDHPTPLAVRFVAFVNEEAPWNGTKEMGSAFYAAAAKEAKEDLRAVINMDMVGFFTAADRYLVLGADDSSNGLAEQVEKLVANARLMPTKRVGAKDPALHDTDCSAFWEEGVKSVFVSSPGFWLSDNYHKPSDTWDKLSYDNMALIVRSMVTVAEGLGRAAEG